jgi:hypothetical protein
VKSIAKLNPAVIAIDVNLRSPDPLGKVRSRAGDNGPTLPVSSDYVGETADLLQTIRDLPESSKLVLARSIGLPDEQEALYVTESDVYDGFDFQSATVALGYIDLPDDIRYVPPVLRRKDKGSFDSFAIAIVRQANPGALTGWDWTEPRFGGFLTRDTIPSVPAHAILHPGADSRALAARLQHHIVLIGGDWHRDAVDRGPDVDSHYTPVGDIPGVFVHANYVETILFHRLYSFLPGGRAVDLLLSLLLVYVLALDLNFWVRISTVILLVIASLMLSCLLLLMLGVFCDVLAIDVLLIGHWFIEGNRIVTGAEPVGEA